LITSTVWCHGSRWSHRERIGWTKKEEGCL